MDANPVTMEGKNAALIGQHFLLAQQKSDYFGLDAQ